MKIVKLAQFIKDQDLKFKKQLADHLYMSVSELDMFLDNVIGSYEAD